MDTINALGSKRLYLLYKSGKIWYIEMDGMTDMSEALKEEMRFLGDANEDN
jgi:hypothetical protein